MTPGELDQPTDLDLVRQARRGDPQAMHVLIDRHAPWLFRVAVSMVGSHEDAEDLLQEVFLAASGSVGRFEGRSSVKTWLRSILLNHVSKLYRSRKIRRTISLDDDRAGSAGESARADMESTAPNPAVSAESRADVQAMLQTLSDEHRQIIVLREIEGLSYEEMAKLLGVPRGTIESRLHRARQQLKEKFAGYLEEPM
jgi:RNA polymerase sigma-70 factor, ECF subfamily